MGFSGKSAVVTGAGGGMGLAVARGLLAQGCDVALLDLKRRPQSLSDGLGLPDGPGRAAYHEGDVADESFVARAVASAHETRGRLDYLVNAAAVLWFDRDKSAVEMDMAVWDRVLAINLKGAVHAVRHAVPRMKATGGGAMVHIATIQCLRGDPVPQDAYQASKAGLVAFSKSVAIQFARDRIRSNALLPGPTLTPMQARWEGRPDLQARVAEHIPLGRLGTPADQANACLFLLSDKAAFITGTELVVDGGVLALP